MKKQKKIISPGCIHEKKGAHSITWATFLSSKVFFYLFSFAWFASAFGAREKVTHPQFLIFLVKTQIACLVTYSPN